MKSHTLAELYRQAHYLMRNSDGLQPQEALDELLKYLFVKQQHEIRTLQSNSLAAPIRPLTGLWGNIETVRSVRKAFATYAKEAADWVNVFILTLHLPQG